MYKHLIVPDFMKRKAPPGYIAGLGRGAIGFTTRSDIGPARDAAVDTSSKRKHDEVDDDNNDISDDNNDDDTKGLFASSQYDAEDDEADNIYMTIDERMDARRKKRREIKQKKLLEKMKDDKPSITQQFANTKKELSKVTEEEWELLPEVTDMVRQRGDQREKERERGKYMVNFAPTRLQNILETDVSQFGRARDKLLGQKLDKISDSVSGQTVVDPRQFLSRIRPDPKNEESNEAYSVIPTSSNDPSNNIILSESEIKRQRKLLQALLKQNRSDSRAWIALLNLEKRANGPSSSTSAGLKNIIAHACMACPKSVDVWLEAISLEDASIEQKHKIINKALDNIKDSVKLWMFAINLQDNLYNKLSTDGKNIEVQLNKKSLLLTALNYIPDSSILWNELSKIYYLLRSSKNIQIDYLPLVKLLEKAVAKVPQALHLWLSLSSLQMQSNNLGGIAAAQSTLNKARKLLPNRYEIWIMASRLAELQNGKLTPNLIIRKAYIALSSNNSSPSLKEWLDIAYTNEIGDDITSSIIHFDLDNENKAKFVKTAEAIVDVILQKEIETINDSIKQTLLLDWLSLAQGFISKKSIVTSKHILKKCLLLSSDCKEAWTDICKVEYKHNGIDSVIKLLEKEINETSNTDTQYYLSLLLASILNSYLKNIEKSVNVLLSATNIDEKNPKAWLLLSKIYKDNNQLDLAYQTLLKSKEISNAVEVWIELVNTACELKLYKESRSLAKTSTELYPNNPTLWAVSADIELNYFNDFELARNIVRQGLNKNNNSISLWLRLARIEYKLGLNINFNSGISKARAILSRARSLRPNNIMLYLSSIKLEELQMNYQIKNDANNLHSKSLVEQMISKSFKTLSLLKNDDTKKNNQDRIGETYLWSLYILQSNLGDIKVKSKESLLETNQSEIVISSIGRKLWELNKFDMAYKWFYEIINGKLLNPEIEETESNEHRIYTKNKYVWAWTYLFVKEYCKIANLKTDAKFNLEYILQLSSENGCSDIEPVAQQLSEFYSYSDSSFSKFYYDFDCDIDAEDGPKDRISDFLSEMTSVLGPLKDKPTK